MKTSTIVFRAVVVGLLSAGAVMYLTNNIPTNEDANITDLPPTNKPSTSAPGFAIEACVGKEIQDSCVMEFGGGEVEGICFQSGSVIACGPTAKNQPISVSTEEAVEIAD